MIIRDRDSFTRDEKDSFTFSLEWHLCQVFHWLISGKTIYWGQEDVAAYYVYGKMAKRIFRGFRQTQLASHHMCHHDQSVFLVCFVTLLVCLIQDMAIAWENSGKCLTICALKAGKVIIQSICPQDAKFTFNWFFSSAREREMWNCKPRSESNETETLLNSLAILSINISGLCQHKQ